MDKQNILQQLAFQKGKNQSKETIRNIKQSSHQNQSNDLKKKCNDCNQQVLQSRFENHRQIECPGIYTKCEACSNSFPNFIFEEHLKQCSALHSDAEQNQYNFEEFKFSQDHDFIQDSFGLGGNSNKSFNNGVCGIKRFQEKSFEIDNMNLNYEMQNQNMIKCEKCNKQFDSSIINDHMIAHLVELEKQKSGESQQNNKIPQFENDIENFIEIEEQLGNIFGQSITNLNQNMGQVENERNNQRNQRPNNNLNQRQQQIQRNQGFIQNNQNMQQSGSFANNYPSNQGFNQNNQDQFDNHFDFLGQRIQELMGENHIINHNNQNQEIDNLQYQGENISDEDDDQITDSSKLKKRLPLIKFKKEKFKNCEKNSDKLECQICMGDFKENEDLRLLQCLHHYHQNCIDKWFDKHLTCPICKTLQKID